MKTKITILIALLWGIFSSANAQTCGTNIFVDEFSTEGALPAEWTEYNTTGQVTVDDGMLKFDFSSDKPAAYRSLSPVSDNVTVSFDVKSTRNWVKCQVNLISSSGKYITGLMIGNDGAKNVLYATALSTIGEPSAYSGALLGANYSSNTLYSLGVSIDFEKQTLSFYNDVTQKATDIAFLEAATDIAKIEIIQVSMYSSEGRFFFDNIALSYPGQDRSGLSAAIGSAEDLTFSTVISPLYGYSQETYEALKSAQALAAIVFDNCAASEAEIAQAEQSLSAAITDFEASYQDEVVLKLFSGSQLQGDEVGFKCGYYNGSLGSFEDKAVSFQLEKGYMLTVAQDLNGAGVSKVYIAGDEQLRLNFPKELQQSISFLRVGPWRDTEKKGSSGKSANNDVVLALEGDWYYDWGNADVSMTECEYVPMNWSGGAGIDKMTTLGSNMKITHHLAFNEPDGEKQANMSVDNAIEKYEILQASGLRLGAPAVTDGAKGRAWLDEFMPKAIAAGYRIDFIPVHYYKIMTAASFKTWLKDFYDEYQVPIWVTEFNYGDIWASNEKDKTEAQVLTNMTAYCEMMDQADFVERYCVFTWQPSDYGNHSLMSARYPITLNTVGEYYANHESPMAYVQDSYVNGPNLSAGISSSIEENEVSVHPNPVSKGIMKLNYADGLENQQLTVKLFNLNGQEVKVAYHSPQTLNVSDVDNGIYLLRIVGQGINISEKVMINH